MVGSGMGKHWQKTELLDEGHFTKRSLARESALSKLIIFVGKYRVSFEKRLYRPWKVVMTIEVAHLEDRLCEGEGGMQS
jgi:hypothetical protein